MNDIATNSHYSGLLQCISAASFLTPIWVPPESSWLEHAPFGFWLIDALRPHAIVELGTNSGYSFATFCQAAQTLSLDCRCYGVGLWGRDTCKESTGEERFRAISDHVEARYNSSSSLIRSNNDEARSHFADGSIDLLHINRCHLYKAALADFMSWRSGLSESGVVLFHHTNVHQQGLGGARLWQELARDHKHFEFAHGFGLGVLGAGETFPAALEHLFAATYRPQIADQIRLAYSHLGSIISLRTRCAGPERHLYQQNFEQGKLSARVEELELELGRLSTRQAYLIAVNSLREAEIISRDETIKRIQTEREHEGEQLKAERDSMGAIASLRATEINRIKSEQLSLLNSTSWRITAPLRSILNVFRSEDS